ncbi:hypothetical protein [Sphingosinithalassobacter portus]|uniref:hypothetical protein n=1 Tax=Stakelama portus TaxID=2676234 RepID=UPI00187349D2|nr:hypothetical protein [Sphingosinithalassobacter portus]
MSAPPPRKRRRPAHPVVRVSMLATGTTLIVVSPFIGVIPGPGGVPVFALGLVMVLRHSRWARFRFVKVKQRWPKFGNFADRVLRRPSAQRRRNRKAEAERGEVTVTVIELDPVARGGITGLTDTAIGRESNTR